MHVDTESLQPLQMRAVGGRSLVTEMIEVFSEFFPKILRDNCLHNTLVGTPESGVKTIPEGFGCALNESRVGCALNEIRNRFDYIIINYFVRF